MTAQRPTFGKKPSATAQPRSARAPVAPSAGLSPAAMAFMERERQGAGVQPSPAMPWENKGSATATGITSAGSGKPVWGRRVLARIVDELLVWFLLMLVFRGSLGGAVTTYIEAPSGSPEENMAAVTLFGFGLIFAFIQCLYNILMEASSLQATLGKLLVGAVVTAKDGTRPSLGGVILRNTVGRFCVNVIPFSIGYIMGLFRKDRRCIHDLISSTMVRQRVPGGSAAGVGEVFA